MPIILQAPQWSSSKHASFFEKLHVAAKDNWSNFADKSPYTVRLIRDHAQRLGSNDPAVRERAERFRQAIADMDRCKLTAPCNILGCRRCSFKRVYSSSLVSAKQISVYTTSRRGRAVALGIGSVHWKGTIEDAKSQLNDDILVITHILEGIEKVEGYRLSLDIDTCPTGFCLHLHGSLLVRSGGGSAVLDELLQKAHSQGCEISLWGRNLKGSYKDANGTPRAAICSIKDAAKWCCYQSKLSNGGKLRAEEFQAVQQELYDQTLHWSGGRLSGNTGVDTPLERQRVSTSRLSDEVTAMQQYLLACRRGQCEHLTTATLLLDKCRRLQALEDSRLQRLQQYNFSSTFSFDNDEITLHEAVRTHPSSPFLATRRLDAMHRYQQKATNLLWLSIKQHSRSLTANKAKAAERFTKYLADAQSPTSCAVGTCVVAANLAAMRKHCRVSWLAAGSLDKPCNRTLEIATTLDNRLLELNEYWPALRKTETHGNLNWKDFWARWRQYFQIAVS